MQDRVSMTAVLTAYARAYHATHDQPVIFDDALAWNLFTQDEHVAFEKGFAQSLAFFDPELDAQAPDDATRVSWVMQIQNAPIAISRARYTEDRLTEAVRQGVEQYVILGAGLDTFAFRKPDLLQRLNVFEVDHPATQADKRRRIEQAGWKLPPELHFVPVDFAKDDLAAALERASFDPRKKSAFSWLGVTYYLPRDVVFDTLRRIAAIAAPGSSLIFDYLDADAFVPERAAKRIRRMQDMGRNIGEPMKTGFDPSHLAADLGQLGWTLKQDLAPADIQARYFSDRTDRYRAFEHVHYAWSTML